MRYTLTWLPEAKAFRVSRADGKVAQIPAPMFRKLVKSAGLAEHRGSGRAEAREARAL